MSSFATNLISKAPITHGLLQTIRSIGEYKGKQQLFQEQSPQVLEALRQTALIQSTESSNRIEGVTAPFERIKALVAKKTKPRDRSEQEIAGYRDVLNAIHTSHKEMPFHAGLVLQFHRDLFKFTTEQAGRWKSSENEISQVRADGSKEIRFKPVASHLTEDAMRALHERFNEHWESQQTEPLLLIATYVLDFLCIHPFRDGNGRLARLLTLLLLYRAGYEVGRFISLEMIVEQTKESYYDSLYQSSQKWHESRHSLLPWWEYFNGVMLRAAYGDFEKRAGMLTTARGAKTEMVLEAIKRLPISFRMVDVERVCPNVTREMIRVVMKRLKTEKRLRSEGFGPAAIWKKPQP